MSVLLSSLLKPSWALVLAAVKLRTANATLVKEKVALKKNSASTIAVKNSLPKTNVLSCALQALGS